jgi:hypothetical protein
MSPIGVAVLVCLRNWTELSILTRTTRATRATATIDPPIHQIRRFCRKNGTVAACPCNSRCSHYGRRRGLLVIQCRPHRCDGHHRFAVFGQLPPRAHVLQWLVIGPAPYDTEGQRRCVSNITFLWSRLPNDRHECLGGETIQL